MGQGDGRDAWGDWLMDAGPRSPRRLAPPLAMLLTLGVGAAGGTAFFFAGAPASFLTGSAIAVLAAVLCGMPPGLPDLVRTASFAILGVMMGAAVSPDQLADLARAPLGFVGLAVVIAGATVAGYQVLRRVGGWDEVTALLGAIPGNLTIVMAVSIEHGARVEQVVMAQALRLFILVALVPFAIGGPEAAGLRTTAPADFGATDVVVTVFVAFASAFVGERLRLPAAHLTAPLLVAVVLSTTGLATIAVPEWLAAATFVILGASIGVRFHGMRRAGLRRMLLASLLSFVAAFAVAIATTALFWALLPIPFGALFLAYAPGGLDAMIALSFLLHYDVAFVAMAHTVRMVALGIVVPVLTAWWVARLRARPMLE